MKSRLLIISLIVLSANSLSAQEQLVGIPSFLGLNNFTLPDATPPGTFTALQNFIINPQGRLSKRWAFSKIDSFSASNWSIRSLYVWRHSNDNVFMHVLVDTGSVSRVYYTSTPIGSPPHSWTLATPNLGSGVGTYTDWFPFNSKLIITAAIEAGTRDSVRAHNPSGSSLTTLTTAPVGARFVCGYKNYLFVANNGTSSGKFPSRLWFSNLGDETTWSANDYIDIEPYDGDIITGLAVFKDALWIFKNSSIFVLAGDSPSNFIVQRVTSGIGCVNLAHATIKVAEERMFFLSWAGVFEIGPGGIRRISDPIGTYFSSVSSSDTRFSPGASSSAAVLLSDHQYWLAFLATDSAYRLLVYDYEIGAWTEFTETFWTSAVDFDASGGIVSGPAVSNSSGTSRGYVYAARMSDQMIAYYPVTSTVGDITATGVGTKITAVATFSPLSGGIPHLMKQWRYLYGTFVTTANDTLQVSGINTTRTVTATSGTSRFRTALDTRSKALSITLTDSTKATRPSLGNFLFVFLPQQWEQ